MKFICEKCKAEFTTKNIYNTHIEERCDIKKIGEIINVNNIEKILKQGLNTTEKDILDRNILKIIQSIDLKDFTDIKDGILQPLLKQINTTVFKMKNICIAILSMNIKKMEEYKTLNKKYQIGGIYVIERINELLEQYYKYKIEYLNESEGKAKYITPENEVEENKEIREIIRYMNKHESFKEFYDNNDYNNIMIKLERCVMIYNFIMCRFECRDYIEDMMKKIENK